PAQLAALKQRLADADLFLTTVRPAAVAALELDPQSLRPAHAQLCQTLIVGYAPPDENRPGHDLNFQAHHGLVQPPTLPTTLIADLAGAERAVSASLALLLERERTGAGGTIYVALADAARELAGPVHSGLTAPDGLLAGKLPIYRCYRCSDDSWVACGLLEEKFVRTFMVEAGIEEFEEAAFAEFFATETADHWVGWAEERDLPISRVR
ncbi:MAG: CoA transferase, partial [Xanthomonadales bacterium]|nr:CoA transferase [Xanthomonadales bacterium]